MKESLAEELGFIDLVSYGVGCTVGAGDGMGGGEYTFPHIPPNPNRHTGKAHR